MPLPKGIYTDPQVRRAWVEERRAILADFDRLVAAGWTTKKAARQLGHTDTGMRMMRESVERLEGAEWRFNRQARAERIDLGLALLSVANPAGDGRQALSAREIAAWCDCSAAAIQNIERRALGKLYRRLDALRRGQVIQGDFGQADALARPLHPLADAA